MRKRSLALAAGLMVFCVGAQPATAAEPTTQLFWGDTHVHTSYSLDANLFNNLTLGPEEAYRFARGEEIKTGRGALARLDRPLDFLVVSDHAAYMGVFKLVRENDPASAFRARGRALRRYAPPAPPAGPVRMCSSR